MKGVNISNGPTEDTPYRPPHVLGPFGLVAHMILVFDQFLVNSNIIVFANVQSKIK